MFKYCTKCLMPNTKPDLRFDESGVCNACTNYENRDTIDWEQREKDFSQIIEHFRSKKTKQPHWDCIVPVSGGKDSTYQVLKLLSLGLKPLCVNSTTCDLSEIGRKNLDNIKNLGVDMIEISPNPIIRHKLNKIGLTQVGDISWPEHIGIFTIPVTVAVNYKIPLIIWGENSQNEYGGPEEAVKNNILDRRWLEEFGGLLGLRVSDLEGFEGLTKDDLIPYFYPSDEEVRAVGVTGLFLGQFFPWDGLKNALLSQAHGFHVLSHIVEGSMVNYENLDNHQTGIHDYFKYLKFGFGRATDIACLHIRRGRISRQEGRDIVKRSEGKFPWVYLDKPLEDILAPLDMTVPEFIEVCDRFTNKKLFKTNSQGELVKDAKGNLIRLFEIVP
jgi:N-acetyl sugar amidotransferase